MLTVLMLFAIACWAHVQIQAAAKRAEEKGVTTDEVASIVLEALTTPEPEAR